MLNIKINNLQFYLEKSIAALYGFNIFLLCMPYFIWNIQEIKYILVLINGTISLLYFKKFKPYEIGIILPLFFLILVIIKFLRFSFPILVISAMAVFTILLVREEKIMEFLRWFKLFFVISLVLSLINYIFVVFLPINIKYNLIAPLNELKEGNYFQYPFLVSQYPLSLKYISIRFCGMFDEPGVVGTLATLLLFSNKYSLKSKQNIVLFIAGIFSFSLYFYLSSFFLLFYLSRNRLRIIYVIVILLIFAITSSNPILSKLVWDRVAIEDNWIAGDNRGKIKFDAEYNKFVKSKDLLWGRGHEYTRRVSKGASTYKILIMKHGLLFFLLVCFTFTLYALVKTGNIRSFIAYLFLFLGLIYTRPTYDSAHMFFLLIACLYAFKNTDLFKRKEKLFLKNKAVTYLF